jgi:hypothetical protein
MDRLNQLLALVTNNMSRLICIISVALLFIAEPAVAKFRGPISGFIETSDGRNLTDVVVLLKCSAQGIQRNVTSESETRIVETGKRFRILWIAPAAGGCSVRAADEFKVDLGVIKLEPYLDVLSQKPSTAVVSRGRPWPFSLLYTHLGHAYSDFALVHPAKNRPALAKYADPLFDIFERSVAALPTSMHDDNPSITKLRQRLADYQLATGWQAPNDRAGFTASIQAGDLDSVRTLIDAGVDLDAWDSQGNSLLHIAAVENHPEIITLLLDAGADIDRQRWGSGDTPVLEAVQHHNDEVTLLLLKRGADRTRRHQECSRSSAHYYGVLCRSQVCAQRAGRAESVTTHLELGADPQAKDADGIAAVDKAQAKGHDKIAELLSALVK